MNEFGAIHKGYFEVANLIPKRSKSFTHYSTSSLEPLGYFNPVIPTQCNEDEDSGI